MDILNIIDISTLKSIWHFFIDYILGFILLISILVFIHEYGHYIVAKLCGVHIEAFSIGFGPEIIGWTDKSGTRWKVAPIPIGGYVKMKGEMINSPDTTEELTKDNLNSKNLWQKSAIVLAGPLANLIIPFIIFIALSFFTGVTVSKPKIVDVTENSPAYNLLQKNDLIKSVAGKNIDTFTDLKVIIDNNPEKTLKFIVERNTNIIYLDIKIGKKEENGRGYLGVLGDNSEIFKSKYDIKNSFSYAAKRYIQSFALVVYGFIQLFTGNVPLDNIGGPISIAQMSGNVLSEGGFSSWWYMLAIVSFNLAIFNLIPIPPLDGGYLFSYLIQGITRNKFNSNIQISFLKLGAVFLMLLTIVIIIKDIIKIF